MLAGIVMLIFKPYDYGASVQRFKKIEGTDNSNDSSADTKWRSVKIRPGLISCERAASFRGQVFLSQEAPSLPLQNCTEEECNCHYIFLDDRRSGADRRIDLGKMGEFFPTYQGERRQVHGRREADLAF
jgi:hypothetical protein